MTPDYQLEAPGQPVSAKNHMRPLKLGNGRTIIAAGKAITAWYAALTPVLKRQWPRQPLAHPVHVTTHQYLKHAPGSPVSPDGDNVQSAIWDVLVKAGVLQDDRWVVSWSGTRQQDKANPRVIIEITLLTTQERAA